MKPTNSNLNKWLLFIALSIIWGSSFILMKRGLDSFTSSQIIAIRVCVAFIVLTPFLFKFHQKSILKHWKPILAMGLFGIFIPGFLFVEAQKGVSSATVSMINSMVPLFTVVFTVVFFNEKIKTVNIIGILVGFIGAAGLVMISKTGDLGGRTQYMVYALVAAMFNGVVVVIIKNYLGNVNAIAATTWALVFVGPISGIYLFSTDFMERLTVQPEAIHSLVYVGVLGIFGTALSIIMFNMLLKMASPVFGASVTYVVPVVAIGWGMLDGEVILPTHILSIIIILAGVFLVSKKEALQLDD